MNFSRLEKQYARENLEPLGARLFFERANNIGPLIPFSIVFIVRHNAQIPGNGKPAEAVPVDRPYMIDTVRYSRF